MSSPTDPSTPSTASEWNYATLEKRIAVSPETLWEVVSDPDRRAEWGADCTAAARQSDDSVILTRPNGQLATEVLTRSEEGTGISWQQSDENGNVVRSILIDIDPAGAETRVHLQRGWPQPEGSRPARAIMRWIVKQQLRQQGAKLELVLAQAA